MERIVDNPFYVLALPPSAARVEVERQGQKLIGMLELGLASAASYPTPLGMRQRTAEKVRHAMAELRDPERRLLHELWARAELCGGEAEPDRVGAGSQSAGSAVSCSPWSEAFEALGWGRR